MNKFFLLVIGLFAFNQVLAQQVMVNRKEFEEKEAKWAAKEQENIKFEEENAKLVEKNKRIQQLEKEIGELKSKYRGLEQIAEFMLKQKTRVWTLANGKADHGELIADDGTTITLELEKRGEKFTVDIKRKDLHEFDVKFLNKMRELESFLRQNKM